MQMFKNMFAPKIETVGTVSDFLQRKTAEEVTVQSLPARLYQAESLQYLPIAGLLGGIVNYAQPASAEGMVAQHVANKIIVAFDPIVQMIQGLAYPVGLTMMCAGFLIIMTGNRHKGINMIKWAAIGFVGMQFAPAIMAILVEVGQAMMAK
jgi:hypothetical protein